MKFRQTDPAPIAAAKSGFSSSSAYRIEKDLRLPSQRKVRRERRRPDPLADVWQSEIVPILEAAPGLRPIAIFEEGLRRRPELGAGVRRPWSVGSAPGAPSTARTRRSSFARSANRGVWVCPTSPRWAISPSPSPARRSTTVSTTSAWPSPASSMPTSSWAAKAMWPSPRAAERPLGARWRAAGTSQRQPVGRFPQSRPGYPRRSDPTLP